MALQGFVESDYLAAKLAALQADSATATDWAGKTTAQLKTFLANVGFTPESHYQAYGWAEGLAPNDLFNAAEYKLAKATDMFNKGLEEGGTAYATVADALAAFESAWDFDPYLHYLQYGSAEGINPSNDFDESEYLASKLADLKADAATATEWADKTVDDVKAAFAAAGLSALDHYQAYGEDEGIAVTEVPAEEKVASSDETTGKPGETFNLTTNQDTLTGTVDNDTFEAGSAQDGAGNLINTLQTVDTLDGAEGNDTLNVTLTDVTSKAGPDTIAPTLTNIENVSVRFADTANMDTLDLSLATGVTGITVQNSANIGQVDGIGKVSKLTVQNQNKDVNFDGSTATTLDVTAKNVGTTAQVVIDLGAAAAASKAKTLNLALDTADVEIKDSTGGDVVETLTVSATGKNTVNLDNGDATVTSVKVTGTGSVDLGNGGTVTLAALKTLDATDNKGGVTVETGTAATSVKTGNGADKVTVGALAADATINTGAGNDTITTGALTAGKTFTIEGGDGNDTIDLSGATAAAIVKVDGGEGNDTVKLDVNLDVFNADSTIDGGAGTNTVGIADGADLTAATVKLLSNFQVLDVTKGTGTYDVSLLTGADTISATGADFTGNVVLDNVLASTVTNISSNKATALTFTKDLTFTPKDASATDDTLTVNIKAVDGDNDGIADGQIKLGNVILTDDSKGKGVETVKIVSDATPDADDAATSGVDETLKVTDYTNTITKLAGTANNTTLDVQADAGLTITTVDATLTGLGTINVSGAGDFAITNTLNAAILLTAVDASEATGAVTIDASANTKAINYTGSEGVDTFKAGTSGDVIYSGKGADVIDLSASAAKRDTIVLKAQTDSFLTDTSKDGKITIGADTGFDTITGFSTGGATTDDIIDLTNFDFSGYQKGVVDVTSEVTFTTDLTSIDDLFADAGGDRGVAFTTDSVNTAVLIDVNQDGNFTAADDIIIAITGVTSIAYADVVM